MDKGGKNDTEKAQSGLYPHPDHPQFRNENEDIPHPCLCVYPYKSAKSHKN
jgi:hypothetical protein